METIILSWGYGNRPIEALVNLLATQRVDHERDVVVIDTRASARHAWTNAYTEMALTKRLGGHYLYAGDSLGNLARKEPGPVQWVPTSPLGMRGATTFLGNIKTWCELNHYTPLFMCCEMKWERCHRQFVAQRAIETAWQGWVVEHL